MHVKVFVVLKILSRISLVSMRFRLIFAKDFRQQGSAGFCLKDLPTVQEWSRHFEIAWIWGGGGERRRRGGSSSAKRENIWKKSLRCPRFFVSFHDCLSLSSADSFSSSTFWSHTWTSSCAGCLSSASRGLIGNVVSKSEDCCFVAQKLLLLLPIVEKMPGLLSQELVPIFVIFRTFRGSHLILRE